MGKGLSSVVDWWKEEWEEWEEEERGGRQSRETEIGERRGRGEEDGNA